MNKWLIGLSMLFLAASSMILLFKGRAPKRDQDPHENNFI